MSIKEEKKEEIVLMEDQVEEFANKIVLSVSAALQVQGAFLGDKLGWYDALAKAGPLTSVELASLTNSSERYAREWLELQAVSGWVQCENISASPQKRKFQLPPAHAEVLTNPDSQAYLLPFMTFQAGLGRSLDALAQAYKTDKGVSWNKFGNEQQEALARLNRPFYLHVYSKEVLRSIPSVHEALKKPNAKVADIGVGYGWSCVGVAQVYQNATIDAFDIDAHSMEQARKNVADHGLEDRIQTHCQSVLDIESSRNGSYDLVTALECLHDMPDPISALRTMKSLARQEGGTVLVMDEATQESFQGHLSANPLEQILYGISCTSCLPDSKSANGPSAATGTCMRPGILRMYAQQAGFKDVEILPFEHDFFRFYKLIQ